MVKCSEHQVQRCVEKFLLIEHLNERYQFVEYVRRSHSIEEIPYQHMLCEIKMLYVCKEETLVGLHEYIKQNRAHLQQSN